MNLSKIVCFLVLTLFSCISMFGQDIRFSQFTNAPQNLNPAMIGFFEGSGRITANYRNQWDALGFKSYFASVIKL